jgi:hypothetical protein
MGETVEVMDLVDAARERGRMEGREGVYKLVIELLNCLATGKEITVQVPPADRLKMQGLIDAWKKAATSFHERQMVERIDLVKAPLVTALAEMHRRLGELGEDTSPILAAAGITLAEIGGGPANGSGKGGAGAPQ